MTSEERHHQMDAARIRAELTVQDLWLRYLALGGTGDAFDVDGYLQGLVPLDTFQTDVLAQTLNEGLRDLYQAHRILLSAPAAEDGSDDRRLHSLMEELLDDPPAAHRGDDQPPGDPPS